MSKKFSLVKFVEDDILYVAPTKKIKILSSELVKAPYKNMGFYDAVLIRDHDEKLILEKLKEEMTESAKGDEEEDVNTEMLHQNPEVAEGPETSNQDENLSQIISENDCDATEESLTMENDQEVYRLNETGDEHGRRELPPNNKYSISDDEDDDDSIADPDFDPSSESDTPVNEDFRMDVENIGGAGNDSQGGNILHDEHLESPVADDDINENEVVMEVRGDHQNARGVLADSSPTMDYRELYVVKSTSNVKSKQHFCKFCKKLQTKFARHLENKHANEKEVQEFIHFPKKDKLRAKFIQKLRHEGDFIYNTKEEFNNEKNLIVTRCPKALKSAKNFKPCGICGGMYSKTSLAYHFKKCTSSNLKNSKNASLLSKRKSLKSSMASRLLRMRVLPHLREDEVGDIIRSDETVILFGNRLCQKYRSHHLGKMIRAKLRCVATFVKTFWQVTGEKICLVEMIDPTNYDNCILTINKMCGLDENTGKFKSPATAFAIGSHLKKISFYLISEHIKNKDKTRQEDTKNFLLLLEEGLSHDINKTVQENQLENKRKKKVIIPSSCDIQKLRFFLEDRRRKYVDAVMRHFNSDNWKELLGVVLISLQLFNRRRAGELERIEIEDFLNYEALNEEDEMLREYPESEKEKMKKYVRFIIRGKLSRGVPVMVSRENFKAVKLLLNNRIQAGVHQENKYLFGIPGDKYSHLSATKLMRKFSILCGADNPNTLRGTQLRKHIATKCATMNLGQLELKDVANYLGHHEKIHMDHYRLPNVTKDIVSMSNILEEAQGEQNVGASPTDEDNSMNDDTDISFRFDLPGPSSANSSVEVANDSAGSIIRRISWGRDEKNRVLKRFSTYIDTCEMPPVAECQQFLEKVNLERSIGQLRGFISNEIKRRKLEIISGPSTSSKTKVKRNKWSDEEKKVVFKNFHVELMNKTLPSAIRCRQVIQENPILKNRTPEQLKAFVNNHNKKGI